MEWDDVRLFLALVRAKSLGPAALELGIDRSTASRRIAALERSIGATLFLRTREGFRPSVVAERLRPHAEKMEAEARALVSTAVAGELEVFGTVRVATTEALAAWLVQEGLLSLRQAHPALVLELLGGNRPVDLARDEADLALRLTPTKEASLRVRRLGKLSVALFASPSYLRARGQPRSESELAGHDVCVPCSELARLPEAKWLASRPGVREVFRSSSMPALVEAVAAGAGLGVITRAWGDGHPNLERLFEIEEIPPRPIWLVSQPIAPSANVRVVAAKIGEIVARVAVSR
ncbi:MAG: LysR family transcriptional regulator [Polyangiales bacterium]